MITMVNGQFHLDPMAFAIRRPDSVEVIRFEQEDPGESMKRMVEQLVRCAGLPRRFLKEKKRRLPTTSNRAAADALRAGLRRLNGVRS